MSKIDIKELLEIDNKNKEWTKTDKTLARLFDDSEGAPSELVLNKRKRLLNLCDRLYDSLPVPECWKTELTLANELNESKRQIAYAKRVLQIAGRVQIKLKKHGNYPNKAHCMIKLKPVKIRPVFSVSDVRWDILCRYSPAELTRLSKAELFDIFDEANLNYIPLHYPQYDGRGKVSCSCGNERCRSIGKHPILKFGDLDFSDPSVRKRMRGRWQYYDENYNIAFVTNNFAAIDIDFRHYGHYRLGLLEEDYGEVPKNIVVKSGNGYHYYVPTRLDCKTAVLGYEGIDIRSRGGYIIAPGSRHKSGKYYEWVSLYEPEPISEDFLYALSSDYLGQGKGSGKGSFVKEILETDHKIYEGQRNDLLFAYAAHLRDQATPFTLLISKLRTVNEFKCVPPLEDYEIRGMAKSVQKYPTRYEKNTLDMGLAP